MKALGIVRKVDELGRIVLPIEIRRRFDIKHGDSLEVYVEGEALIYKKYRPTCIFCGESDNIEEYKGKDICSECLINLKKLSAGYDMKLYRTFMYKNIL